MIRREWTLLRYLFATALLALALSGSWRAHTRKEECYGRYTARQVLDHSVPLYRLLDPRADRLKVSVEHTPEAASLPLWITDATDEADGHILRLEWKATTGELWYVSISGAAETPVQREMPALTPREVVHRAWIWTCGLGLAEPSGDWQLADAPARTRTGWLISWKAGERRAAVQINGYTGKLVIAMYWRAPSPGTLPRR